MQRTVQVLHQASEGLHVEVFEWTTKKEGTQNDVLDYLLNKFNTNPPAGYRVRPIQTGDRLRITLDEGPFAGEVTTYELVSSNTVQKLP
jgi:hypothetical protein